VAADGRGEAARRVKAKGVTVIEGGKGLPPQLTRELTILVPKHVGEIIDQLYELVKKHYPHQNDFLEDLLKEGLKSALDAQRAAQAALMEAAEADMAQQSKIEIADRIPANIVDLVLAKNKVDA
jgi:hypothetical protein